LLYCGLIYSFLLPVFASVLLSVVCVVVSLAFAVSWLSCRLLFLDRRSHRLSHHGVLHTGHHLGHHLVHHTLRHLRHARSATVLLGEQSKVQRRCSSIRAIRGRPILLLLHHSCHLLQVLLLHLVADPSVAGSVQVL